MKPLLKNVNSEEFKPKFVLHPKRFKSDSECSLESNQCGLLTGTPLRQLHLEEDFNCVKALPRSATTYFNAKYERNDRIQPKLLKPSSASKANITNSSATFTMSVCYREEDKKFRILIERTLAILSKIGDMLQKGSPLPDGEEDYQRRIKRLHEFAARFSRVYLYPLLRQMNELSVPEKLNPSIITKKISCAQQTILQGLQAYCNHLPTSIEKCCVDKLGLLLGQTLRLCNYCDFLKGEMGDSWEFINALQKQVNLLLETLNIFNSKFIKEKTVPCKTQEQKKKKTKISLNNNKTKSRLSMYNSHPSSAIDQRHLNNYGKKMYCVKSKYMHAGYKHRPPVQKDIEEPCKVVKLYRRASTSSKLLQNTPRRVFIQDEDIQTMVASNMSIDSENENVNHENNVASCRQLVQDKDLIGFENKKINNKNCLQMLEAEHDNRNIHSVPQKLKRNESINLEKRSKEKIVSITGPKNAKLICIQDNSLEYENEDKEVASNRDASLECEEIDTNKAESNLFMKISKLSKQSRPIKVLPKTCAINIIQYKLRYNQLQKDNPMYKKSARIQPWMIMSRISDNLFDYLLYSITGALEIQEMLENLYQAEFQY